MVHNVTHRHGVRKTLMPTLNQCQIRRDNNALNRSAGVGRFWGGWFNPGTRLTKTLSGLNEVERTTQYKMAKPNPYESASSHGATPGDSKFVRETSPASWVAIFAPLIIQTMATCTCGHLHIYLLPITAGLLCFAFFAYSQPKTKTTVGLIGLVVAALFFGKHMGDILWLGHDPLIPFP